MAELMHAYDGFPLPRKLARNYYVDRGGEPEPRRTDISLLNQLKQFTNQSASLSRDVIDPTNAQAAFFQQFKVDVTQSYRVTDVNNPLMQGVAQESRGLDLVTWLRYYLVASNVLGVQKQYVFLYLLRRALDTNDRELMSQLAPVLGVKIAEPAAPQGNQPAPQGNQSVPQGNQPVPQGNQPAPQGNQPIPQGNQPTPQGNQPTPQGNQTVANPAPQGNQPAPQGNQPAPKGNQPAPPMNQTVANPAPPMNQTVANLAPPMNQTVANPAPPMNQTVANPAPPMNQTVANLAQSTNQTIANSAQSTNQTIANSAQSTNQTIANSAPPVNQSVAKPTPPADPHAGFYTVQNGNPLADADAPDDFDSIFGTDSKTPAKAPEQSQTGSHPTPGQSPADPQQNATSAATGTQNGQAEESESTSTQKSTTPTNEPVKSTTVAPEKQKVTESQNGDVTDQTVEPMNDQKSTTPTNEPVKTTTVAPEKQNLTEPENAESTDQAIVAESTTSGVDSGSRQGTEPMPPAESELDQAPAEQSDESAESPSLDQSAVAAESQQADPASVGISEDVMLAQKLAAQATPDSPGAVESMAATPLQTAVTASVAEDPLGDVFEPLRPTSETILNTSEHHLILTESWRPDGEMTLKVPSVWLDLMRDLLRTRYGDPLTAGLLAELNQGAVWSTIMTMSLFQWHFLNAKGWRRLMLALAATELRKADLRRLKTLAKRYADLSDDQYVLPQLATTGDAFLQLVNAEELKTEFRWFLWLTEVGPAGFDPTQRSDALSLQRTLDGLQGQLDLLTALMAGEVADTDPDHWDQRIIGTSAKHARNFVLEHYQDLVHPIKTARRTRQSQLRNRRGE